MMPVKKYGLGLLNTVTPDKEKYLSSQRRSGELIRDVTEGGAFSNDNQLLEIREESRDVQKNWDDVNDATLKGLVQDLKGTDQLLIITAKNIGALLRVRGNTVAGTVFPATEFWYFLCACYNVSTLNLQNHYGGCGNDFGVTHSLSCNKGGLVIARHNKVRGELLYISQRAFTPESVRTKPIIHQGHTR